MSGIARVQRLRRLGVTALAAALLAGCAVGPDFVRPQLPPGAGYLSGGEPKAAVVAGGEEQHFVSGAKITDDWWRLFGSAKLDGIVRESLAGNQSVQAARATLRQSDANLRAVYGVFFPQADATFQAVRQKQAGNGGSAGGSIFNLFTLSASVSYALDIFGGERRSVEGLRAQADVQRAQLSGTYLTLTGNIVTTVVAEAGYRDEIRATQEMVALMQEEIEVTEAQVEAGTVPYANLLSLRSQLATIEATLAPLRQKVDQSDHLLALLSGRTPAEWLTPEIGLADLTLPGELPLTLPSDLVRQRPDILAAEAQLHAASAEIGVATAKLFPSFTLDGSFGRSNNSIVQLFSAGSGLWSIALNASAPLFHGGTLWSQKKAAEEAYQASLANYRLTVLSSFSQVADTLRALEHDGEALRAQSRALETADEALRLIRANYQAGIATYLQLLVANSQYHQAQIGYLQAKAQRLQDSAALYVALGGGWGKEGKPLGDISAVESKQ